MYIVSFLEALISLTGCTMGALHCLTDRSIRQGILCVFNIISARNNISRCFSHYLMLDPSPPLFTRSSSSPPLNFLSTIDFPPMNQHVNPHSSPTRTGSVPQKCNGLLPRVAGSCHACKSAIQLQYDASPYTGCILTSARGLSATFPPTIC